MDTVVKLALKLPRKLRVVQIAWMQGEVIGVYRHDRPFEADDHLDHLILGLRIELKQRVFVQS